MHSSYRSISSKYLNMRFNLNSIFFIGLQYEQLYNECYADHFNSLFLPYTNCTTQRSTAYEILKV